MIARIWLFVICAPTVLGTMLGVTYVISVTAFIALLSITIAYLYVLVRDDGYMDTWIEQFKYSPRHGQPR